MTTDTAARLAEIRERLKAALPGPWYFTASNGDLLEEMCCVMPGDIDAPVLKVGHFGEEQVEANWDLCVEAPEAEAFLLSVINQQAAEIERLKTEVITERQRESMRCVEASLSANPFTVRLQWAIAFQILEGNPQQAHKKELNDFLNWFNTRQQSTIAREALENPK